MKIEKFEDLISWQRARLLSAHVYKLFKNNKDFSFRDQIQRAVISIGNNIAEGFERKSNGELKHFFFIAKGSCAEVRSMAYTARDLHYIANDEFDDIHKMTDEISKLLSGFIKKLS